MKCTIFRRTKRSLFVLAAFLIAVHNLTLITVFAISEDDLYFYGQNNILYTDVTCFSANYSSSGAVAVVGETMEEKIWSALTSFMTAEQAAGAMGNMAHEGMMNPVLHEGRYQDSDYDIFTDSRPSYGIGLIQWSYGRRVNMLKSVLNADPSLKQYFTGHAYNKNYTNGDAFYRELVNEIGETNANTVANNLISLEISYLQTELNNSRSLHLSDRDWSEYFKINSVEEAANYWFLHIEAPGDSTGPARVAQAQKYYQQFANKKTSVENTNNGGCEKLTSAPDYKSLSYQEKLKNLRNFSQTSGAFSDYKMCNGRDEDMYWNGCGIMSVYAMYYMFSGVGLNNEQFFNEFLAETRKNSAYNQCTASDVPSMNTDMQQFLQVSKNVLYDDDSYSSDRWDVLINALNAGKKIVILVSHSDGSIFANGGHYMLLDHYDTAKDMIYLFDPAMGTNRISTLQTYSNNYVQLTENPRDGIYVSRAAMNEIVKPKEATAFTYGGCYNGGLSGANVCRAVSYGLSSGGMSYDEAVQFMSAYRSEAAKRKTGNYGGGYTNGSVIGEGYVGDAGCWAGTLNNCVAFSRWFVNNYTTAGPKSNAAGDGWTYANSLVSMDGFESNGRVPIAYAIFSVLGGQYGHTGVVLGIDREKDEIYIGEAGCTAGYNDKWPGVHKYSLSAWTNSSYNYAYPGDKLKF